MKKSLFSAGLCVIAMQAMAQETYESAQLTTTDLNGTARYVGMGGAMEALGADISTMSTNPAGIGLFRRSWVGASAGFTAQQGDEKTDLNNTDGTTNADLNQVGFVYSIPSDGGNFFNIGFNYHKGRNFNQVMNAQGSLNGSSMGIMSACEDVWAENNNVDMENGTSLLNQFNYKLMADDAAVGTYSHGAYFMGNYDHSGFIADYDLNFSVNLKNRVFLGATVGFKDIHYKSSTQYGEDVGFFGNTLLGSAYYNDERRITGTGFDLKFGAIFVPSDASPFRLGVYMHTPTWYEVKVNHYIYGQLDLAQPVQTQSGSTYAGGDISTSYDWEYKITTPWRFGFSMGHTFGSSVALGATYEYADYSFIKNKVSRGTFYDYDPYWDDYYSHNEYSEDLAMNDNTKQVLKATHTLKLGAEIKPVPEVAIRLGYNYVSPAYKTTGQKDYMIDGQSSPGKFSSTYEFVNWKATNRVTFGLGFSLSKNWTLDMAYQYATQKGDFHTFGDSSYDYEEDGTTFTQLNPGAVKEVKNDRHQFNLTLGYRF